MNGLRWLGWLLLACASGCASEVDLGAESAPVRTLEPEAQVYRTPFHQGPVRAAPGDTIILPGDRIHRDAVVVYRRLDHPDDLRGVSSVPHTNTADSGTLLNPHGNHGIDGRHDLPRSLTVTLPGVMDPSAIYALWILNPGAAPSERMLINDPRPRWVTPALGYATAPMGLLGREIKIVGRNLAVDEPTSIVFMGPQTYQVPATMPAVPSALDAHAMHAMLPPIMAPGRYAVAVEIDGHRYRVPNEFFVEPDPAPSPEFHVSAEGCAPNDGLDDTTCLEAAIAAATAAGGGTVVFGSGTWDLMTPPAGIDGFVVPEGVHLAGAGGTRPEVRKRYPPSTQPAAFTLEGHQTVRGLHFVELARPDDKEAEHTMFLSLGSSRPYQLPDPEAIVGVRIEDCEFTNMYRGIASALPQRGLHVVGNVFNAYRDGIFLTANESLTHVRFQVIDSVIAENQFNAGAYIDLTDDQGAAASHLGASTRVDFSGNTADGRQNGGWRAGFFFQLSGSHHGLLVSDNHVSCSGEKGGDGEAIMFDTNHNISGFEGSAAVEAASSTAVEAIGELREPTPGYYLDSWVQIIDGTGIGQARRIVSVSTGLTDPQPVGPFPGPRSPTTRFEVHPPWDVVPSAADSQVVVTRMYHATAMVGNVADNRGCPNTYARHYQGQVGWWGAVTDSVIEGNELYETGGIMVRTGYAGGPAQSFAGLVYASEVHGNLVSGQVPVAPPPGHLLQGGISLWYGAAMRSHAVPLVHNLNVGHNVVLNTHSTAGAISTRNSWHPGTVTRTVIHRNTVSGAPIGVGLDTQGVTRFAIVGNQLMTPVLVDDHGTETLISR